MKKILRVKDIVIGEGIPKIAVPIVGRSISDIVEEVKGLRDINFDLLEWRVDFFEEVTNIDKVKEALSKLKGVISDKPIVFTFRSFEEGGEREIDEDFYFELNKEVSETKLVDIIDIELFKDNNKIRELINLAHENMVAVIISNHDFEKTPTKEEIINRLCRAVELGADIPKIAVMPNSVEDVITLLDATRIAKEKYIKGPVITMSMAGKGLISRLSGELFGSAVTFGAAKKISAPGQISAVELRNILNILHNNL
ncbi:MAG: type I 3-dehydroquinate dehydratase [Clostridiales bacterium]|nr:type I 3-dehydroquinate dehydratase [Clostridiales bacterium]